MIDREREAETQAEGEAGSMPGSRPGLKAGAKPLRHPGIPRRIFRGFDCIFTVGVIFL